MASQRQFRAFLRQKALFGTRCTQNPIAGALKGVSGLLPHLAGLPALSKRPFFPKDRLARLHVPRSPPLPHRIGTFAASHRRFRICRHCSPPSPAGNPRPHVSDRVMRIARTYARRNRLLSCVLVDFPRNCNKSLKGTQLLSPFLLLLLVNATFRKRTCRTPPWFH